ncbi:hypothetical protein TRVL_09138 [Trypanosoma vivax]|nr:hypothetical protein TRVL_09138 [Trypanosoma vivax]
MLQLLNRMATLAAPAVARSAWDALPFRGNTTGPHARYGVPAKLLSCGKVGRQLTSRMAPVLKILCRCEAPHPHGSKRPTSTLRRRERQQLLALPARLRTGELPGAVALCSVCYKGDRSSPGFGIGRKYHPLRLTSPK